MKKTVLYDRLAELGGKFVEFGGFFMPVQFLGILGEHRAVRSGVGIFDVSHMGEFLLEGENAEKEINYLFTNDFSKMPAGKVRYTLMCNTDGGIVDDLLVYKVNDAKYYLVVNASNIDKDREHILTNLKYGSKFTDLSDKISMIAVQGPLAAALTGEIFGKLPEGFYTFIFSKFAGHDVVVSRTGYTGEDGFEIYSENALTVDILNELLKFNDKYNTALAGLGSRDTLRLESAMPLYGHEMNAETLATELGLDAYIKIGKADFVGKAALTSKKPKYRRIGLKITDKGIAREGCKVLNGSEEIGHVTSGTMSPTLGYSVAMARVGVDSDTSDIYVDVRGRPLKAEAVAMPFYKR
ncbi:MAG: glycine cleavage system aminomethyltransferase GcvT [Clostridiales bacterium]|jgi:aminomethyltransferase|nr:glycine cleavage system aminomethyltransferase GcvT [Clostridiales bacterium]